MYIGRELWKNRITDELIERRLSTGKIIETYADVPVNLYEAVVRATERNPKKLAVEDSFGRHFSYEDLKNTVDKFASVLRYRFGIKKKSTCCVYAIQQRRVLCRVSSNYKTGRDCGYASDKV